MSNSSKSNNGNAFNTEVKLLLSSLISKGHIKSFIKEPKYTYPNLTYKQFNPDFEITLNDESIIVIDNTTSARHDRFKGKQWDAFGTKKYFANLKKTIKFFIVLPNTEILIQASNANYDELQLYKSEKQKLNSGNYFTMIDDIIQLIDLENLLIK